MKLIKYITLISLSILMFSCEDVVDLDLDTAAPRLVVDAAIDWVKGTDGSEQKIRLTTTTAFYSEVIPVVTGATVVVTNSTGTIFDFIEDPGTGNYLCTTFEPVLGETYTLTVGYDGKTFVAQETMTGVPDIGEIEQDNEGGFFNDEIEVTFFYQDNPNEENYYLTRHNADFLAFPEFEVFSDEFTNGNQSFEQFSSEDLEPGQILDIRFYGISKRYYEYMYKLLSISGNGPSGPFGTTPARIRGNMRNIADEDNYALGYFRLAEVDTVQFTIN